MASTSLISEDTLIIRALLSEESGNLAQSRNIYKNLYQMTGKKEYMIQEAKDALMEKVDTQSSIDSLLEWVSKNPQDRDPDLYRMLVALHIQKGSLPDAERLADKYLSFDITAEDRIAIANLKLELGKPDDAVDILLSAYTTDNDEKLLQEAVTIMSRELGRSDEAAVLLEKHISKYPDASVGTYFKLIEIYASKQQITEVLALYKKLYKRDPKNYFLQKVIDSSDKKVYMIVDNLRVHHAKLVTAWVEEHKDKIALFYLPPYSPEFNPDEYLNQDYKRNANKNNIPFTQVQLRNNTEKYMTELSQNEEKVANLFKHPSIAYAA